MSDRPLPRLLKAPERTFFLFGPRGVGKTTWLRVALPDAVFCDLLEAALSLELAAAPARLEAIVGDKPPGSWVVVDEIQKLPALLDEIHRLIESRGWRFALCGSSARKLRRAGTNLLGGRAITRELDAFSAAELGADFVLDTALEWGLLPAIQSGQAYAADLLDSYVNTYIRQEIKEEGIVRRLPPFLRFLHIAGLMNAKVINGANIARDASVPRSSVDTYFSILCDTLLGGFLPAYRPGAKVREQAHPKFYWFDPGVARAAAGLVRDRCDKLWLGEALETLLYHELRVYNHTQGRHRPIYYYNSPSGQEIDFVIEVKKRRPGSLAEVVCMEIKLSEVWDRKWERAMHSLANSHKVAVTRKIGVYRGTRAYRFDDVDVFPVEIFLRALHGGELF
jgi:uncharacterized protein